uniref:SprT-like domain-containing protein n=1 Tax=Hucho hucho TaxID=62062 RepID=A0A4W5N7I9_9TELE
MIHALFFVTQNNRAHDGHGPEFCKHMERFNQSAGSKITVYHTFHDKVDLYRQHWWRCDVPCQTRKPYFGYVKRAMNRALQPRTHGGGITYAPVGAPIQRSKSQRVMERKERRPTTAKARQTPAKTSPQARARLPAHLLQALDYRI